jgi:hypothetical protein
MVTERMTYLHDAVGRRVIMDWTSLSFTPTNQHEVVGIVGARVQEDARVGRGVEVCETTPVLVVESVVRGQEGRNGLQEGRVGEGRTLFLSSLGEQEAQSSRY